MVIIGNNCSNNYYSLLIMIFICCSMASRARSVVRFAHAHKREGGEPPGARGGCVVAGTYIYSYIYSRALFGVPLS